MERGERTFTLGDAIEFLQTREKVIERKLKQDNLKAEVVLNRKGVSCEG